MSPDQETWIFVALWYQGTLQNRDSRSPFWLAYRLNVEAWQEISTEPLFVCRLLSRLVLRGTPLEQKKDHGCSSCPPVTTERMDMSKWLTIT